MSWVRYPVWSHTFVSLSADSSGSAVSYWRKYMNEVLVNRLGGLSLPRKSVVRLTDRPDMTLDVYHGRWRVVTYELPIFSFQVKIVIFSSFLRIFLQFVLWLSNYWIFSKTPIIFILTFSFLEYGRSRPIIIISEATIKYGTGCFYIHCIRNFPSLSTPPPPTPHKKKKNYYQSHSISYSQKINASASL